MAKVKKNAESANSIIVLSQERKSELLSKISFDADMVSLTDLWKAAGSIKGKNPNDWLRQDSSKQLIDAAAGFLNTVSNRIIKTKRGKSGGSFAHKQIALAYAKYLDPKLHVAVNEIFFERVEEEKNPDLAIDRGIRTYKRQGKSDEWISKRITGKARRNQFTACLAAHGVEHEGFRNCTNSIYMPLFGGSSNVVREKLGITKGQNPRDHMSELQLSAIQFAESLSQAAIEQESLRGNAQCEIACSRSARIVANAINQNSNNLGRP